MMITPKTICVCLCVLGLLTAGTSVLAASCSSDRALMEKAIKKGGSISSEHCRLYLGPGGGYGRRLPITVIKKPQKHEKNTCIATCGYPWVRKTVLDYSCKWTMGNWSKTWSCKYIGK